MFFALPIRVQDPGERQKVPFVNAALIAANVLVYLLSGYLNWRLEVGPGTGLLSVLTYGFGHASIVHLLGNMWFLWLFGNPVNRRLGNGYYLLSYLGTIVTLGVLCRSFAHNHLIGSSGAIFAVMLLYMILHPQGLVKIGYIAMFPLTLLVGIFHRPSHWLYWVIRWDAVDVRAWVGLILIPFLEILDLWTLGWNWTNLAHLFGLLCSVVIVLLLPTSITMRHNRWGLVFRLKSAGN